MATSGPTKKAQKKPPKSTTVAANGNGKADIRKDRLGEFRAASDAYRGEPLGFRLEEGGRVWLCKGEEYTSAAVKFVSGHYPAFVLECLLATDRDEFLVWLSENPQPVAVFEDVARWIVEQYSGMDPGKA